MKRIATLLLGLFGWKVHPDIPPEVERCVMIAAPHTSNWDFIIARLAFLILQVPVKFTIKKEWMKFPFNLLLKRLGAIPIDRSPKIPGQERMSMVDAMAELFEAHERLAVLITPEGTRSRRERWKTGFYYIAKGAKVPIALGFLDYGKKVAGVGKMVYPSDNMAQDLQEIMHFYKDITPRHKEKFSIDLQYQ